MTSERDAESDSPDLREPGRLRRALCELTGGHGSDLLEAWGWKNGRVFAVALYCKRCGFQTKWFGVKDHEAEEGLGEETNVTNLFHDEPDF